MKLIKKNVLKKRLRKCIDDYFNDTTLHGFRYITSKKSTKFKSYFWSIVCIISTFLCFILIKWQLHTFHANRIATTIKTTAFPIWQVPFPAITLCNMNVVYKDNVQEFTKILANELDDERLIDDFFGNLSALLPASVIGDTNGDINWQEYKKIIDILQKHNYDTDEIMSKLAQPCNRLLKECYWNMKEINCETIFTKIKTNGGFCCSFNRKGVEEINTGSDKIYVAGVGPHFGLEIHIDPEISQYVSAAKRIIGVNVMIHEATEYPDSSIYGTAVFPGSEVSFGIRPEIIESDQTIRQFDVHTRGCVFSDEVKITWPIFNYTHSTCIHRCKSKAVIALCNCIPFYYPNPDGIRVCTLLDLECIRDYEFKMWTSKLFYYFDPISETSQSKNIKKQALGDTISCQCYPQCNEILYNYKAEQEKAAVLTEDKENFTILHIYFNHVSCFKIGRTVFNTWEVLLASVGGLIGLCLGGSILSVIEFVYNVLEALFCKYPIELKSKKIKNNFEPKIYTHEIRSNIITHMDLNNFHKKNYN